MHPEYFFKSNYLVINGNRLHYIDEGDGPVVILVHGNPTWSFYYRNLITLLKKNHRVIALDNIGCGLSDKPQIYEYTLANHIKNLVGVVDELGVSKCSLVVHDWGGAIGFGLAANRPETIEKIVVHNTAAFRSSRIPFRISICRIPFFGEFIVRGLNGFALPATFMAVAKTMSEETKKHYILPYNSWKNRIAVYRFVMDIPLRKTHPSYQTLVEVEKSLDVIKNMNIPIMVLWGGKDFCFNKQFFEEWLERFPKCKSHYFDEFGHYLLEDGWDEVSPYFQSFFS